MKNETKRIALIRRSVKMIFAILLILSAAGCADRALGKLKDDYRNGIVYDAVEEFTPSTYVEVLQDEVDLSYEISEDAGKVTFVLSRDGRTETIEAPIAITCPKYAIADDIRIDISKDYDLKGFIEADEGVRVEASLNEQTGIMTVTFSKGKWTKTVSRQVTISDTMPMGYWVAESVPVIDTPYSYQYIVLAFNEDGRGYAVAHFMDGGYCLADTFTWTQDGTATLGPTNPADEMYPSFRFRYENGSLIADYAGGASSRFGETVYHLDNDFFCNCDPGTQIPPYHNPKPLYQSFDEDYDEIYSAKAEMSAGN